VSRTNPPDPDDSAALAAIVAAGRADLDAVAADLDRDRAAMDDALAAVVADGLANLADVLANLDPGDDVSDPDDDHGAALDAALLGLADALDRGEPLRP
jgi:hypothetical protein